MTEEELYRAGQVSREFLARHGISQEVANERWGMPWDFVSPSETETKCNECGSEVVLGSTGVVAMSMLSGDIGSPGVPLCFRCAKREGMPADWWSGGAE